MNLKRLVNSISEMDSIIDSFGELFEKCERNPDMNEETLRTKFAKKEILETLGYSESEMFIEESTYQRKRTDIHCTDEYGDVVFVIEFKRPSRTEDLESFREELKEKYVNPLKARYGLLYDGTELLVYERDRNRLEFKGGISGKIEILDED